MSKEKQNDSADLVPTGERDLTKRSSKLVRRGLDSLTMQRVRIVHFPDDRSMGNLFYYPERFLILKDC